MPVDGNGRSGNERRFDAIDERVGKIEKDMAHLSSWAESTGELVREIKRGQDRQEIALRQAGRPNWGWMVAACAFVLALVTAIGNLALMPMRATDARLESKHDRMEDAIAGVLISRFSDQDAQDMEARLTAQLGHLREQIVTHQSNGHPHTVIDQIRTQEKRVDELRDAVRRMQEANNGE